eukprot:COSAG02_NODE_8_length_60691_cov_104.994752_2_plen_153_part_00
MSHGASDCLQCSAVLAAECSVSDPNVGNVIGTGGADGTGHKMSNKRGYATHPIIMQRLTQGEGPLPCVNNYSASLHYCVKMHRVYVAILELLSVLQGAGIDWKRVEIIAGDIANATAVVGHRIRLDGQQASQLSNACFTNSRGCVTERMAFY